MEEIKGFPSGGCWTRKVTMVPSLIIATKDDLDPHPMAVQDSITVCQKLGIEGLISVSAMLNDMNNVFNRIVSAAEHPNVSVPETETVKRRKYHQQLISRSLMCVLVGAAAAVGLTAYRVYQQGEYFWIGAKYWYLNQGIFRIAAMRAAGGFELSGSI